MIRAESPWTLVGRELRLVPAGVRTAPSSAVRWRGAFPYNCCLWGNPEARQSRPKKQALSERCAISSLRMGLALASPAVVGSSCAVRALVPFEPLTGGRVCGYLYMDTLGAVAQW